MLLLLLLCKIQWTVGLFLQTNMMPYNACWKRLTNQRPWSTFCNCNKFISSMAALNLADALAQGRGSLLADTMKSFEPCTTTSTKLGRSNCIGSMNLEAWQSLWAHRLRRQWEKGDKWNDDAGPREKAHEMTPETAKTSLITLYDIFYVYSCRSVLPGSTQGSVRKVTIRMTMPRRGTRSTIWHRRLRRQV